MADDLFQDGFGKLEKRVQSLLPNVTAKISKEGRFRASFWDLTISFERLPGLTGKAKFNFNSILACMFLLVETFFSLKAAVCHFYVTYVKVTYYKYVTNVTKICYVCYIFF